MSAEREAVARRFARFARDEAPGRSELYREWATGIAADPQAQALLARISAGHRQPPLVFAVTRLLGSGEGDYASWRTWLDAHHAEVVAECARRAVQTNEPLRCAALLPALSLIDGPIALLELGASAGLCLFPDRYSYRYRHPDAAVTALDPPGGVSPVVLECQVRGALPPVMLPEIVWRAGIDLQPLDPADPVTGAWLEALVWPGETGRAARIGAAVRIAASDPPRSYAGDAVALLPEVAAAAPAGATLVVSTVGMLPYLPALRRAEAIAAARAAGRWVTLDAPGLHEGFHGLAGAAGRDESAWPGGFALALDGEVLAAADPLGGWLEWRRGSRPPRG